MNNKNIAQQLRTLADEIESDMPEVTSQDYWTINIPKGLTIEQAYADCKALFPCWRSTDKDLDEDITSDRTSEKAYSVKVKANIEADEDLKNLSFDDLKDKGLKGITLLERLVLEIDYFKQTGKHLDTNNVTLCSGSRDSVGDVPSVVWDGYGSRLSVYSYGPSNHFAHLRSREVV